MFSIFTPVSNIELYNKFLAEQLKDALADVIEDGMSTRELWLFRNLAYHTEEAASSLEKKVIEAAKEHVKEMASFEENTLKGE